MIVTTRCRNESSPWVFGARVEAGRGVGFGGAPLRGGIRILNQSCPTRLTFWPAAALDAMAIATEGYPGELYVDGLFGGLSGMSLWDLNLLPSVMVMAAFVCTKFVGTFCGDTVMMTNANLPLGNPERALP